jgi:hypothetical protein
MGKGKSPDYRRHCHHDPDSPDDSPIDFNSPHDSPHDFNNCSHHLDGTRPIYYQRSPYHDCVCDCVPILLYDPRRSGGCHVRCSNSAGRHS